MPVLQVIVCCPVISLKITAFFIYVYLSQTLALCNENPLDSTVEIKNKESCKKHWLTDFLQTTKTQSVCIMKVKV